MNNQLIEVFTRNFKKNNKSAARKIGLECEFPLVNRDGKAINYDVLRGMFQHLKSQGFELYKDVVTDETLYATKVFTADQEQFGFNKNVIGTDTGYCTLEVALKPDDNLFAIEQQLNQTMRMLSNYFLQKDCLILGYGIQPVTPPSKHLMANSPRYTLPLRESMNRFIEQRDGVDFHLFTITASNQCHIEISEDEVIRAVNVLNGLSGLQIALTANAPVWRGEVDRQWKAVREIFWDYGFVELWTQIGIPKCFRDIPDYIEYICSFKPRLVMRDEQAIYITDKKTFKDFIDSNEPSVGLLMNGESISIFPDVDDILYHSGFAWFNARISPKYGTIESRISCQQPPKETMVVTALVLGVLENIEEAENLLSRYSWEEWKRFRFDALRHTLQSEISNTKIMPLLEEFTKIAETGLRKRALGEEKFLEPAFRRIADRKAPADHAIYAFQTNKLTDFVELLAFR
jgi:glutamate--cysteine ligase